MHESYCAKPQETGTIIILSCHSFFKYDEAWNSTNFVILSP